jgi:hypothetical protein
MMMKRTLATLVAIGGVALIGLSGNAQNRSVGGVSMPECVPSAGECNRLLDEAPKKPVKDPTIGPDGKPIYKAPPPVPHIVLEPSFDAAQDSMRLVTALQQIDPGGRIVLRPGTYTFDGLLVQTQTRGQYPPFLSIDKPVVIEGLGNPGDTVIDFRSPRCMNVTPGFSSDEPILVLNNLRLALNSAPFIRGFYELSNQRWPEAPSCLLSQSGMSVLNNVEFDLTRTPGATAMVVQSHGAKLVNTHIRGRLTDRMTTGQAWSEATGLQSCVNGGVGLCVLAGTLDMQDSSIEGMEVAVRGEGDLRIVNSRIEENAIGLSLHPTSNPFKKSAAHQLDGVKLNHNVVGIVLSDGYDGQLTGGRAEVKHNRGSGVILGNIARHASCEFGAGIQVKRNGDAIARGDRDDFVNWLPAPIRMEGDVIANDDFIMTRAARDECNLPRGLSQLMRQMRGQSGNNKPSL